MDGAGCIVTRTLAASRASTVTSQRCRRSPSGDPAHDELRYRADREQRGGRRRRCGRESSAKPIASAQRRTGVVMAAVHALAAAHGGRFRCQAGARSSPASLGDPVRMRADRKTRAELRDELLAGFPRRLRGELRPCLLEGRHFAARILQRLITWRPPAVRTGSESSPFFSRAAASKNAASTCPSSNGPRSPPRAIVAGSSEPWRTRSSKDIPDRPRARRRSIFSRAARSSWPAERTKRWRRGSSCARGAASRLRSGRAAPHRRSRCPWRGRHACPSTSRSAAARRARICGSSASPFLRAPSASSARSTSASRAASGLAARVRANWSSSARRILWEPPRPPRRIATAGRNRGEEDRGQCAAGAWAKDLRHGRVRFALARARWNRP